MTIVTVSNKVPSIVHQCNALSLLSDKSYVGFAKGVELHGLRATSPSHIIASVPYSGVS